MADSKHGADEPQVTPSGEESLTPQETHRPGAARADASELGPGPFQQLARIGFVGVDWVGTVHRRPCRAAVVSG